MVTRQTELAPAVERRRKSRGVDCGQVWSADHRGTNAVLACFLVRALWHAWTFPPLPLLEPAPPPIPSMATYTPTPTHAPAREHTHSQHNIPIFVDNELGTARRMVG